MASAKKVPLVRSCCKTSRSWSRIFFCPHHLARGKDDLGVSWRRGQPQSRQTLNPSHNRKSSATHDGERTGWKSLASSRRTVEPGVTPPVMWSTQLVMPVQPAPGQCRQKYKYTQFWGRSLTQQILEKNVSAKIPRDWLHEDSDIPEVSCCEILLNNVQHPRHHTKGE